MFVAGKENGSNVVSTTMKYAKAITYRWALGKGRHPCDILKGESLLRDESGWVRTGLGGVWRPEMLGKS